MNTRNGSAKKESGMGITIFTSIVGLFSPLAAYNMLLTISRGNTDVAAALNHETTRALINLNLAIATVYVLLLTNLVAAINAMITKGKGNFHWLNMWTACISGAMFLVLFTIPISGLIEFDKYKTDSSQLGWQTIMPALDIIFVSRLLVTGLGIWRSFADAKFKATLS